MAQIPPCKYSVAPCSIFLTLQLQNKIPFIPCTWLLKKSLIREHKTYSWSFQAVHYILPWTSKFKALKNVTTTITTCYQEPMAETQGPKPSSTWLEQVNHSSATEDLQQHPEPMWLQKRFTEPEKQQQQSWLGAKHKEINRTERWKISPAATGVGMSKSWSISRSRATYPRTAQKSDGRKLAFNSYPRQLSVFLPSSDAFQGLSWFWVPSLPMTFWTDWLCAPCSAKPRGTTANPRQQLEHESSHRRVRGVVLQSPA